MKNYISSLVFFTSICFRFVNPSDNTVRSEQTSHEFPPLGSHKAPEGVIDTLNGFPTPQIFYEEYVKKSKPVLFSGAASEIPAFHSWTDDYLKDKYGDFQVDVEEGKKENRSQNLLRMSMSDFLDVYTSRDFYMVQDVYPEMSGDLSVPKSLLCGGFQDVLELAVMWFSSGGTKSVLHYDSVDNINCIFSGQKTIVFIDKKYASLVEAEYFMEDGAFSMVDVDHLNPDRFPSLMKAPWWYAQMETGDCLYLPTRWYHTVKSSDSRNLAVNLWFVHMLWFNQTDCDNRKEPLPEMQNLTNHKIAIFTDEKGSIEKLRCDAFEVFEGLETILINDALAAWDGFATAPDIQDLFEYLDENKDMIVSWEEVYKIDIMDTVKAFPFILPDISAEELSEFEEVQQKNEASRHDEL